MAEYAETEVARAFVSMTNCHTCLKEGLKMQKETETIELERIANLKEEKSNLKEFKINVFCVGIEVDIWSTDPCDALAISGAVVKALRMMDKEPKAKVMS